MAYNYLGKSGVDALITKIKANATAIASLQSSDAGTVTLEHTDGTLVYTIKQGGNEIGTINIPKDQMVQSGSVVTLAAGDVDSLSAGTYIKLVLNDDEGTPIYINVGDLIEYVTADEDKNATSDVVVTVSSDHKVSAALSSTIATKISNAASTDDVATAKSEAITTANNAIAALDATVSQTASASNGQLALSVTETNGKITKISGSITANTYDAYGAAAAVVGTSTDAATAVTVYGAKAYADSLATNYATAAQGALADTALQESDFTEIDATYVNAQFTS